MQQRIIRLIAEIDEFKGLWRGSKRLSEDILAHLRRFATIESIGSSTRIEGAKLTDQEVENLLSNLETYSFRSRDEQEVAGYAEAIRLVYEAWNEMDLTESMIKSLHKQLLQYSEKDDWHIGEYKKHPNHVAAIDADGRQIGIVFETTSPFETPLMMSDLLVETRTSLEDASVHPLLVIGEFILRFLAIHPFQDGNGRLARILTNLLLLRSGYEYVPYSSLERLVEANKEEYYRALRRSQITLDNEKPELEHWLVFFLEMLKKQKDLLEETIQLEQSLEKLPPISGQIVDLIRQRGKVTPAEIVQATNVNRNTVKYHLRQLVETGKIKRQGRGRGSFYTNA